MVGPPYDEDDRGKVIMGGSLDSLVESAIVCDECGLWTLNCGFWVLDWEGDDEDDVVKAIVGGRLAAGCACDEGGEVRVAAHQCGEHQCGGVRVGARAIFHQQARPTPPHLPLVELVAGGL